MTFDEVHIGDGDSDGNDSNDNTDDKTSSPCHQPIPIFHLPRDAEQLRLCIVHTVNVELKNGSGTGTKNNNNNSFAPEVMVLAMLSAMQMAYSDMCQDATMSHGTGGDDDEYLPQPPLADTTMVISFDGGNTLTHVDPSPIDFQSQFPPNGYSRWFDIEWETRAIAQIIGPGLPGKSMQEAFIDVQFIPPEIVNGDTDNANVEGGVIQIDAYQPQINVEVRHTMRRMATYKRAIRMGELLTHFVSATMTMEKRDVIVDRIAPTLSQPKFQYKKSVAKQQILAFASGVLSQRADAPHAMGGEDSVTRLLVDDLLYMIGGYVLTGRSSEDGGRR